MSNLKQADMRHNTRTYLMLRELVLPLSIISNTADAFVPDLQVARDLAGSNLPCRLEGEVQDLVVLGEVPKAIDGSFYRVMCDPFVPPHKDNVPIDGDGNISVFQFHDGRVSFKSRYIETERYKLERKANQALFGLYRNPFTHHPCVRYSQNHSSLLSWRCRLMIKQCCRRLYSKYEPSILGRTFTRTEGGRFALCRRRPNS